MFKFYEPVVEDDVLLEFVPFGKDFEAEPVGFAMLAAKSVNTIFAKILEYAKYASKNFTKD